jgi:preprotein translocase subunit SecD
MNRYPLWKYLGIAFAIALGFIYTLPNFYGEVPAVQVSPLRSNLKVDANLMSRVETLLKEANLNPQGVMLDSTSIKARFGATDLQLKAKDVLQAGLGDDYVVALNLLSRSPEWLTSIGALPMYLGLDLRGGVHFLMQVDIKTAALKKIEALSNEARSMLREQRIAYSSLVRDGQTMTIAFREAALRDKALSRISKDMPDLELQSVESGGEFRIIGKLKLDAQRRTQEAALQQNINTLRKRVNELGVAEPIIQQQGADRVVVQLPGVQDTAKAKDILGRTATLEVRMVEDLDLNQLQLAKSGQLPVGTELFYERNGQPVVVKKQVVLTGERINGAQPGFDNQTQEPAVHIALDGAGARIFQQVTRDNVNRRMAILLFERGKGEVITAPVIRAEISGGRVQISGRMTTQEANDVSLLLRSGALAAPMEIVEERTVGPSLGADNIRIGIHSTLYGFCAIAVFMIVYYAMVGVFSVLALGVNLLFLVALLSLLQATLTLPGMAAIALTIGMAIDANVLINERIREELRNGNSPHAAIFAGYDRAWGTILDSNVTTLIAGLSLFAFGSGPVKGFAVVLCLGIVTSIFSAVMVSRALINLFYGSRRKLDRLSIG